MWAHEYHEFLDIDHDFEVLYGYQYYQQLLDENKLELTTPLDMSITFHDGCDAGRNAGFFEEPRKVIEYLPGVEFEELPHNKSNCYCCGSGGVLRAIDNDFAVNINQLKVEDIERTNVDYVISGCPSCVDFFKGQLPETGSNKISMDLAVLVAKAMGLDWEGLEETY
jgi:Fe-S oxidoreductase